MSKLVTSTHIYFQVPLLQQKFKFSLNLNWSNSICVGISKVQLEVTNRNRSLHNTISIIFNQNGLVETHCRNICRNIRWGVKKAYILHFWPRIEVHFAKPVKSLFCFWSGMVWTEKATTAKWTRSPGQLTWPALKISTLY